MNTQNTNLKKRLNATTIETPRLLLKKLDRSALPDMYEYGSMPAFYSNLDSKPFQTYADAEYYFERLMDLVENKNSVYWAIWHKHDQKVIGTGGIRHYNAQINDAEGTLGISPLYQNGGLAVESFGYIHEYCFNQIGVNEIYGIVSSEHTKSIKMLDRIGYLKKLTLEKHFTKLDGRKYDAYNYVVSRDDFNKNSDLKKFLDGLNNV